MESFSDPLKEIHYMVVFTLLHVLVFLFAFFGNLFVLILFVKCKVLRKKTNFLLGNLIISDFFVSIFCIIPHMLESIYELAINSTVCKVTHYAQAVAQRVSVLTLMAISIERYVVILKPMKSCEAYVNKLRLLIVLIWTFSFLYNVVYAIHYDFTEMPSKYSGRGTCFVNWEQYFDWMSYYEILNICLFFVLPSFLMLFVHIRILIQIYKTDKILYHQLSTRKSPSFLQSAIAARHVAKRSIIRRLDDGLGQLKLEIKAKSNVSLHTEGQVHDNKPLARSRSFEEEVNLNEFHETLMNLKRIPLLDDHVIKKCQPPSSTISSITSQMSTLRQKKRQTKILKLMIIILCCFVFNSLPFTLNVLFNKAVEKNYAIPSRQKILITNIVYILYFSNSALNCFLYALYSSKFRNCAIKEFPLYARLLAKKNSLLNQMGIK